MPVKKSNKKRPSRRLDATANNFPESQGLNPSFFLFIIMAIALLVRIFALMDLSTTIYMNFLLWDEQIYHSWAKKIAEGTFQSRSLYEYAPLQAYIMAAIYRLFSPNVFYIRVLSIVYGTLTCGVIYLIGKELADRKVAILACLVACIYKPFIFYSIVPLKESLSVLLFALMSYLLVKAMIPRAASRKDQGIDRTGSIVRCGLLGLIVGMLLNVRPNTVVLIPVIFFLLLWHGYREKHPVKYLFVSSALYVVGLSVAISPFVMRNYVVTGRLALTTTQTGFNLYIGNNIDNPDPYYRPVPFASSSPFEQGIQFTIEASRRVGKKLTSEEASHYWTAETMKQSVSSPSAFISKMVQKMLVLLNRFEACDHYDIEFISNFAQFFKIPFLNFWMVLPFSMVGMLISMPDRRAKALFALILSYAATLVIFFTNGRYRLPMLVVLIPFAALGIEELYSELSEKRYRVLAKHAVICCLFVIIAFLPLRATDDVTAYYNTHAIILSSKGSTDEAILYWKRSSDMMKPFSAYANLSLAGLYYRRGNIREGNAYLAKIPDESFAAAQKYQLWGDLLATQGKLDAAAAAYEKSLSINSGQIAARRRLIDLYKIKDPPMAQRELQTLTYIESFYDLM